MVKIIVEGATINEFIKQLKTEIGQSGNKEREGFLSKESAAKLIDVSVT